MELKNKNIVVVGLARTGASVARFLCSSGAKVTVSDSRGRETLAKFVDALQGLAIEFEFGRHGEETFRSADLIVVSPGVPMDIVPLKLAGSCGIPIISEIELAASFIDAPIAAITGTNGKTTTTTLAGEIFKGCGFSTFVGGNIGKPLIDLVTSGERVHRVVAEISSFQLEGIVNFHPKVAVLLNLTEDHLDRYSSFQEYIDAKMRIFANQTSEDFAILNIDDPLVADCSRRTAARIVPMSRLSVLEEGIFYRDNVITFSMDGRVERFATQAFKLRGVHNLDNCMAALAAALLMGCDAATARAVVENFTGLRHRMELVSTVNGVQYYNDSKGTNVGSVVKSLESFPGNIILIAGGKDKGGEYTPLADLVRERVRAMILLGEAKDRIRSALGRLTETVTVGSLEEAVREAHRMARPGDVVLFSPACSSYDMFKNYEERGDCFAAAVRALEGRDR